MVSRVIIDVVGDEQVQVSIAIEVEESGRCAPSSGSEGSRCSDICEMKVSEIAVQATVAESGQAEIAEAIIVEITDGNTTRYSCEGQLSGLTDILKTTIGLLLQDLQQRGGMFRQFG